MAAGRWNFSILRYSYETGPWLIYIVIILASCTKRAQIPFSAWLPAAMAAPTPVSSLVHSSTLVTAGVYLIFRFFPQIIQLKYRLYLTLIGGLTMLIAGMAAILEIDIKKIVALSTLSQLGVIISTLGAGLYKIAFFHLLSHAYFKALLFIAVGAIIHISRDYQDLRKISLIRATSPVTLRLSLCANLSLCGLPFTSGFFSKDSCIEAFIVAQQPIVSVIIFYLATALTVAYTVRFILMVNLAQTSTIVPVFFCYDKDFRINYSILGLFPLALMGGSLLRWTMFKGLLQVPIVPWEKNITIAVITLGGFMGASFTNKSLVLHNKIKLLGHIWSLPHVSRRYFAQLGLSLS